LASIVLIHGGWHGAWCWARVVPLLEKRGHRVLAPDLPGHGADPASPTSGNLALYAERVLAVLDTLDGPPPILVGHSLAGLVISLVAEARPERIARLVYLTAFLPRNGDSLVRIATADPGNPMNGATVRTADGKGITVREDMLRILFYGDCSDADLDLVRPRLVAEPYAALFGTVSLTAENFGRVPRAYIHCARDVALPLFLQQMMVAATPCDPVLTLNTGHSPFLSAPADLAEALAALLPGPV
jgi:pimeloyl-ACP methyl ester carboxylesterase